MIKMAAEEVNSIIKHHLETIWMEERLSLPELKQIRMGLMRENPEDLYCAETGLERFFPIKKCWFSKNAEGTIHTAHFTVVTNKRERDVQWSYEREYRLTEGDMTLDGKEVTVLEAMQEWFADAIKEPTFRATMKFISLSVDEQRMNRVLMKLVEEKSRKYFQKEMEKLVHWKKINVVDAYSSGTIGFEWEAQIGSERMKGQMGISLSRDSYWEIVPGKLLTGTTKHIGHCLEEQQEKAGKTFHFLKPCYYENELQVQSRAMDLFVDNLVQNALRTKEVKVKIMFDTAFREDINKLKENSN